MMFTVTLRPYQSRAIGSLRGKVREGHRRVLLVLPTGGGKTVIAADAIRSAVERGRRVIVIAHRRELIDQTVAKLAAVGVAAGVMMGDDPRADPDCLVQVCTIQTLHRRLDRLPPADLIVYDEAHHCLAESSQAVLARYPNAVVIGLTATPWRADGMGLGDFFQAVVVAATPAGLIADGSLVPSAAFAYASPDLRRVRRVAGEYHLGELEEACGDRTIIGSAVKEYMEHAHGRRAIVFAVSVAHSQAVVAEFIAAGVAAAHVDWATPPAERSGALAGLADGSVRVISSVGILTEGFDCPAAEVAILARPTLSMPLHLQMIGRVLRPAPGKLEALIHDHAGNLLRHGFAEDERDCSLKPTPASVRERHTCPQCKFIYATLRDGCCPNCHGLIAETKAEERTGTRRSGSGQVPGDRIGADEIRRLRERRAAAGALAGLPEHQLRRVASATRAERAAEYRRLQLVAERRGFKPGFAAHQYRAVFGVWPRFTDEELDVAPASTPFLPLEYLRRSAS